MTTRFKLLLFFQLIGITFGFAQINNDIEISPSEKNAISKFVSGIRQQSRIFNGPTYYTYGSKVDGTALFLDSPFVKGKLVYEHETYDQVPLMYDLYINKLVSINKGSAFSFVSEKVNDFYIEGYHFSYINTSLYKTAIPNGFFEVAYEGKSKVLIKRSKKLKFSTRAETPYYFKVNDEYFLLKDNQLLKIDSESALLSLFKDKKSELKKYLAREKIKFNQDPAKAMVAVTSYYEKL